MEENERKNIDNSLKFIAKSSSFILIGVIFSKIASYIYRVSIARYFGPEVYGLLSLSLMITGWLIAFAMVGVSSGVFRFIPIYRGKKEIDKVKYMFRLSSAFFLFTGLIAMVILFLLAEFISLNIFHNPNLIIFLKLFSISIPLSIFMNHFTSITLAYGKVSWYSFSFHILGNLIKIISLFLFILIGLGVNSVIFSHILGIFVILVTLYFVSKYLIKELFQEYSLDKNIKLKIRKELFSYSWPFLFSTIVIYIFYWTDSFMIGYFLDVESVGFYNVAIPIALLLTITTELFMSVLFPLATKEYARKNFKIARELMEQVGKWIFLINIPILILIFVFSKEIISILFGSEYLIAESALRILSFGVFFSSILNVSQEALKMMGKSKLILLDIIVATLFNMCLNFILIPKYGISGAAISTAISLIFLNFVMFFQAKYYFLVSPLRKKTGRILIVSLISTIILLVIVSYGNVNIFSFIFLSFFYILFYFLLILITGCLDKNDFTILKSFKKKLFK